MASKNVVDINSDMIYKSYLLSLSNEDKKRGFIIPKCELNGAVHEVNRRIMNLVIEKNFHF